VEEAVFRFARLTVIFDVRHDRVTLVPRIGEAVQLDLKPFLEVLRLVQESRRAK
jgi:hypothetical protein